MLLFDIRHPFYKLENNPSCRVTHFSGHLQTVDEVVAYRIANPFSQLLGHACNDPIINLKSASTPERFLPVSSDWQAYLLPSI